MIFRFRKQVALVAGLVAVLHRPGDEGGTDREESLARTRKSLKFGFRLYEDIILVSRPREVPAIISSKFLLVSFMTLVAKGE